MRAESKMICIHCGEVWTEKEVESAIEIKMYEITITDFFCPGCSKIMNGCTKVEYGK